MEENQSQINCTICGDELKEDETPDLLCPQCVDAWQREVDSHW